MLRLKREAWSPLVSLWLGRIKWNTPELINTMIDDVRDKKQSLYVAYRDEVAIGCCVVRLEKVVTGNEMVVTALGGEFGSLFFMMRYQPYLDELARINNCVCVRAHVDRKGLKYIYEKFSYVLRGIFNNEWVLVRYV